MSGAAQSSRRRARPRPTYTHDSLRKRVLLTPEEAAFYVGYTEDKFLNPVKAFMRQARALKLPRTLWGKRVRFKIATLDQYFDS